MPPTPFSVRAGSVLATSLLFAAVVSSAPVDVLEIVPSPAPGPVSQTNVLGHIEPLLVLYEKYRDDASSLGFLSDASTPLSTLFDVVWPVSPVEFIASAYRRFVMPEAVATDFRVSPSPCTHDVDEMGSGRLIWDNEELQ